MVKQVMCTNKEPKNRAEPLRVSHLCPSSQGDRSPWEPLGPIGLLLPVQERGSLIWAHQRLHKGMTRERTGDPAPDVPQPPTWIVGKLRLNLRGHGPLSVPVGLGIPLTASLWPE